MRLPKFNRGDAVIHRGEVKSVQSVAWKRTAELNRSNLYYTVKGSDCTTAAVRSDHLDPAIGYW